MENSPSPQKGINRQTVGWIVLGLVVLIVGVVLVLSLQRPPQMGSDEAVFNTVDALYTAVRNQDDKQLTASEVRLIAFKEAGKLPKESAEYLERVIATARSGGWETAAHRLYDFMLVQRRDGFEPSHNKNDKHPKHKGK